MTETKSIPDWADAALCEAFPRLLRAGESDVVEFMQDSSRQQARDLAKEIAALARTGGLILLGVTDDGQVKGLVDCETPEGRDQRVGRIQGLSSMLAPPVSMRIKFISHEGKVCIGLDIPPHPRPVYYCEKKPYIRHHRESRPAEPDEVIELIREWLGYAEAIPEPDEGQAVAQLNRHLLEVLVECDLLRDERRFLNPWLENFASRCEMWAGAFREDARELAATPLLADRVKGLAKQCDELSMKWTQLQFAEEDVAALRGAVEAIKAETLDSAQLSGCARATAREYLTDASKRLRDLIDQAVVRDGMKVPDTMTDAGSLGAEAYAIALYPLNDLPDLPTLREKLRALALVETMDMYWDGGESWTRMMTVLREALDALDAALAS
jgi:hypothetical protein